MQIGVVLVIVGVLAASAGAVVLARENETIIVDIIETGPDGLNIVFWRILQDDRAYIHALVAAGLDIETKGFQDETPVISAAAGNAWITTKLLIELGADTRAVDLRGFTLPWLANKTQINSDAHEGRALTEVRALLAAQGLMRRIYKPREVKAMVGSGDWPPPGW